MSTASGFVRVGKQLSDVIRRVVQLASMPKVDMATEQAIREVDTFDRQLAALRR